MPSFLSRRRRTIGRVYRGQQASTARETDIVIGWNRLRSVDQRCGDCEDYTSTFDDSDRVESPSFGVKRARQSSSASVGSEPIEIPQSPREDSSYGDVGVAFGCDYEGLGGGCWPTSYCAAMSWAHAGTAGGGEFLCCSPDESPPSYMTWESFTRAQRDKGVVRPIGESITANVDSTENDLTESPSSSWITREYSALDEEASVFELDLDMDT